MEAFGEFEEGGREVVDEVLEEEAEVDGGVVAYDTGWGGGLTSCAP